MSDPKIGQAQVWKVTAEPTEVDKPWGWIAEITIRVHLGMGGSNAEEAGAVAKEIAGRIEVRK